MTKVGFRVVTEIVFHERDDAEAVELDLEALRKEMGSAFAEVVSVRIPQAAEANGYTTEKVQVGVHVFHFEPTDEEPTHEVRKKPQDLPQPSDT